MSRDPFTSGLPDPTPARPAQPPMPQPEASEAVDGWSADDAAAFARRTVDYWNATGGSDDPMKVAAKVHAEDVLAAIARLTEARAEAWLKGFMHREQVGLLASIHENPYRAGGAR